MSRNLTYSVDKNNAKPKASRNSCKILSGTRTTSGVNEIPDSSAKIITTTRLIPSDIRELIIADNIMIYFGKLIFRRMSPRPTIEFIPTLVASVKKLQSEIPSKRTIGYHSEIF